MVFLSMQSLSHWFENSLTCRLRVQGLLHQLTVHSNLRGSSSNGIAQYARSLHGVIKSAGLLLRLSRRRSHPLFSSHDVPCPQRSAYDSLQVFESRILDHTVIIFQYGTLVLFLLPSLRFACLRNAAHLSNSGIRPACNSNISRAGRCH